DIGDRVFRNLFLRIAGIENRGPVARTAVVALPIKRGRVVDLEEKFQERAETGLLRIENNFDCFGVALVMPVSRIPHFSAGISNSRRNHAGLPADEILHAPEAAAGEDGTFLTH